jgi:hypothetical protein
MPREVLGLTRREHLQGGSDRKKRRCDSGSVGMYTSVLSFKASPIVSAPTAGILVELLLTAEKNRADEDFVSRYDPPFNLVHRCE